MAINDVYQIDFLYSLKGEKCANVFFAKETTDPGSANETTLATGAKADVWTAALRATMSNDCELQTIRVRRVSPSAGGPIMLTVNEAGSVAQDSLPPNNCVVISYYSNTLTKRGRGRQYYPGVPKTHNQDGLLPASVESLYNAVGTAMTGTITQGGGVWDIGVWSRTGSSFAKFTFFKPRSWIHTLRSRRMAAP